MRTGRYEGFLREQTAIARDGGKPSPFRGAADWRILLGPSDMLCEPEIALAYWRELLPGARFRIVPDGGRFLATTHPGLVVQPLKPE